MTRSAPSFVSNSISAIVIGCVLRIRHLLTKPPTGSIALSMSAAVVPGAKFCANTTYGPASPRIEMPLATGGAAGAWAASCCSPPLRLLPPAPALLLLLPLNRFTCAATVESCSALSKAFCWASRRRWALGLVAVGGGAVPGAWMRAARLPGLGDAAEEDTR